jgi:putrescine transport system permease protein
MRRGSHAWFNITSLTLGFAFLYLPMVILVIYSFNDLEAGHGLGRVLDQVVWRAFPERGVPRRGLGHAQGRGVSSTIATVLGTMAASCWCGRAFPGRTLFSGMIYAPLVMPEVITGLSLLLLFIGIGLDRGSHHRARAHHLFDVLRLGRGLLAARHLRPLARGGRARSRLHAVRRPSAS